LTDNDAKFDVMKESVIKQKFNSARENENLRTVWNTSPDKPLQTAKEFIHKRVEDEYKQAILIK